MNRSRSGTFWLLCAAALRTHAQQVPAATYQVTCPTCKVEFTKLASFGSADDPVLLSGGVRPVRDSKGRYFAASHDQFEIAIFDATGKFLRAFGRKGNG